ncbi:MAG TPA: hypothetical protein VJ725_00230 [Thermoanaerobaculia bacterium]|nr:hypothetical protein [Thermoanaerobaculia bacterium]
MKRAAVTLLGLALVCLVALPGTAWAANSTVKVVNKSDWEIHQFFLSSSEEEEWGPDQLRDDVIGTGESFELRNIPCDTYDVMLVDEAEDECIVPEVDICGENESWVITNKILLACQEAE